MKFTPMKMLYLASEKWDVLPTQEVFDEMFRVSKNQIIWGGNYFNLPPTRCFLMWDKLQPMPTFSACEYAWTSFDKPAKLFRGSSTDPNRQHPTQKPIELMRWVIANYAAEEDLVYDPFIGSGTTLRACKDLGRNYIGSEISKEYCDIAEQRLKQGVLL